MFLRGFFTSILTQDMNYNFVTSLDLGIASSFKVAFLSWATSVIGNIANMKLWQQNCLKFLQASYTAELIKYQLIQIPPHLSWFYGFIYVSDISQWINQHLVFSLKRVFSWNWKYIFDKKIPESWPDILRFSQHTFATKMP